MAKFITPWRVSVPGTQPYLTYEEPSARDLKYSSLLGQRFQALKGILPNGMVQGVLETTDSEVIAVISNSPSCVLWVDKPSDKPTPPPPVKPEPLIADDIAVVEPQLNDNGERKWATWGCDRLRRYATAKGVRLDGRTHDPQKLAKQLEKALAKLEANEAKVNK